MTFRDDRPLCLYCSGGLEKRGERWFCGECLSKLMPARELQDLINEVSPDDWRELDQRLMPSSRKQRMCPLCKTDMTTWTIYDVPVDHCDAHGVWIDRTGETAIVIANERIFKARNPEVPRGALFPLGIGIIFGSLLSPWLDRRRLRKDIERTSPPKRKR